VVWERIQLSFVSTQACREKGKMKVAKNRTRQILGDLGQKAFLSSRTDDEAYRLVTEAGVFMASCGFLNQANTLLTALWSQNRAHSLLVAVRKCAIFAAPAQADRDF
jgi:hypothetical protein